MDDHGIAIVGVAKIGEDCVARGRATGWAQGDIGNSLLQGLPVGSTLDRDDPLREQAMGQLAGESGMVFHELVEG